MHEATNIYGFHDCLHGSVVFSVAYSCFDQIFIVTMSLLNKI